MDLQSSYAPLRTTVSWSDDHGGKLASVFAEEQEAVVGSTAFVGSRWRLSSCVTCRQKRAPRKKSQRGTMGSRRIYLPSHRSGAGAFGFFFSCLALQSVIPLYPPLRVQVCLHHPATGAAVCCTSWDTLAQAESSVSNAWLHACLAWLHACSLET